MYHIGIKRKPTTVKNPQVNVILERLHQVLAQMLHTAELNIAKTVPPNDVDVRHGPFALPIIQSLKPLQAWQYSNATCSLTFRS